MPIAHLLRRASLVFLLVSLCAPVLCQAAPWVWDQDQDGIDDRLEATAAGGINQAFENLDPEARKRFEVDLVDTVLQYGACVLFDHFPTVQDADDLALLGAEVVTRFLSVPYIRVRATYPTLLLVAQRIDVIRVEANTLMYPVNWRGTRALGVRTGPGSPAPALEAMGDPDGTGTVVAVLDTGINDQPIGMYPGHEDLAGKVAGGADFGAVGPLGYTAWTTSVNPAQTSLGLSGYHGTHIAATVAGANRGRVTGGVAPGATLIDVKVLSDEGIGYGVAEGLEWCLQNTGTTWPGGASGVDVINLSLSGTDVSDGTDCVCRLVDAAAAAGVLVVASAGNSGDCDELSNPGAADGAITVAAMDPGVAGTEGDESLAAFSAEGPRRDDGDLDMTDELKPDVTAPGSAVISAWGGPLSSGSAYASADGTSMAAAFVTGVLAILRGVDPSLATANARALLQDTSRHRHDGGKGCSASDPLGVDPRYHTGWGFGAVDAVAAWMELLDPTRTQFVRVSASWDVGLSSVDVGWTTQREADLTGFQVERAPDAGGAPGVYQTVNGTPVPAVGFADLSLGNRTAYMILDPFPPGGTWWYRVRTVGGGLSDVSAPVVVRAETTVAQARFTVTHAVPETDLVCSVGTGNSPFSPVWSRSVSLLAGLGSVGLAPGLGGVDDLVLEIGTAVYTGDVAGALPPSPTSPWWLLVTEGGDDSIDGTVDDFRIDHGGSTYVTDSTTPLQTTEGATHSLWIPQAGSTAAPDPAVTPTLWAAPNPFRARTEIAFRHDGTGTPEITVFDVHGRRVRDLATPSGPGAHRVTWNGVSDAGTRVAAGTYYVRLRVGSGQSVQRVVVLP